MGPLVSTGIDGGRSLIFPFLLPSGRAVSSRFVLVSDARGGDRPQRACVYFRGPELRKAAPISSGRRQPFLSRYFCLAASIRRCSRLLYYCTHSHFFLRIRSSILGPFNVNRRPPAPGSRLSPLKPGRPLPFLRWPFLNAATLVALLRVPNTRWALFCCCCGRPCLSCRYVLQLVLSRLVFPTPLLCFHLSK